jgi:hypothetical protein
MNFDQLGEIAGRATMKEPHELTNEERLALAFMAGCEIETAMVPPDFRYVMRTKNPVGFQKIDGRWIIGEARA